MDLHVCMDFCGMRHLQSPVFGYVVINTLFRENFCMKELWYNGLCANSEIYILDSFVIQMFIWLQKCQFQHAECCITL